MEDKKPRFYVSHDSGGLYLWLSRKRPKTTKSGVYECPAALRMRLPYSWFGHMMRENSMLQIDVEALVIAEADGILL